MFLDGGGASLGTAEGQITIDVSQAQNSLQSLGGSLDSFNGRATSVGQSVNNFSQSTVGLAQGMQNVGRVVTGLGATMEAPFLLAAKSAMDLESTMAGVNAVMDLTGTQFEDLNGLAQQLGKDTVFSGTQVAQGIEELGKAGVSFDDIMSGAAQSATDLAAAGGIEVPKAAEVMSAAMQAFNISGEDSVRVADALAGAANASLSDVNQLGIGLGQVAGVANAAGMSLEETTAFLALMADNGIRGSDAATSMKNAILSLLSPTDKAAGLMDEMGVSVLDASGNFVGLAGASQAFFDAWKGSGKTMEQFLDPLNDIVGRDAVRTILFGMQSIEDEQKGLTTGWGHYLDEVSKTGTAHEVAQKRMDSLAGSIEKLKGSLDVLGENIGLPIITGIRPVVDAMVEFVNAMTNLPGPILAAIGVVGSLAGVVTTLGGAFLVVGGYVLEAVARFEATGITLGEIAAVAGRVTLGLSLIGITAAAVALAINSNFLGIRDAIQFVIDKIQELVDRFQLFFSIGKAEAGDQGPQGKGFWSELGQNISAAGRAIDATFGTNLSPFFDTLAEGADNFERMRVGLQHAADQMKIFTDASTKITPLAKRVDAMGKVLKNVFGVDSTGLFSKMADGVDAFVASMDSLAGKNITGIPAVIASIARGLNEAFGDNAVSDSLAKIASVMVTFDNTFQSLLNDGINPVTAAMRGMAAAADLLHMDGLAIALENGAQFAQDFADSFSNAQDAVAQHGIVGLPQIILALNSAMLDTIGIGLPDFLIGAANAMAAFQTAFSNGIQNGLNPFEAAIKGVGAAIGSIFGADARTNFFNLVDSVRELGNAARELVTSGFDRVGQMFSEIGTALSEGDIQGALTAVQSLLTDVKNELIAAGQTAIDWAINVGAPALAGWAKDQAGRFGEWLKEQLGIVGDAAGQTLATIQNWFIEIGIPQATGWLQQTGADVISWIQDQLDRLIPAAGQKLGEIKDWVFEVGVPKIQEAASEAGSIKDQIIQWIGDQIQFPDVSELPDISAKATAFGQDLGKNLASLLADAMATVRSALFGGGGGGPGAPSPGLGGFVGQGTVEADARQLAGTIIQGFLQGLGAGFAEAVGQANVATFIKTGDFEPLKAQIKTALADALKALPGEIQVLLDNTAAEIKAIVGSFGDVLGTIMSSIGQTTNLSGGVPGNAPGGGATTTNLFEGFITSLQRDFANFKNSIDNLIPDNPFAGMIAAIQGFSTSAAQAIDAAAKIVSDSLNNFTALVGVNVGGGGGAAGSEQAKTIGAGVVNDSVGDMATGATSAAPEAVKSWNDNVAGAVDSAVQQFPPTKFIQDAFMGSIGRVIPQGQAGAQEIVDSAFSPFQDVSGPTTTAVQNIGQGIQDSAAAAAPAAVSGLTPALDQAMAASVSGVTLQALSTAIGQKIGEAVVSGIANASTANVGGSGGGTTAGGIGQSIVGSLTTSIQTADFSAVGVAISTQIGTALSAGFGQAAATGPSTAGVDIGSQIALALASSITGSDFTVVSQAIQQKISQSLSGGTGGTTQTTDTSAAAGEGATIGASIAASLANAILGSDFSVVGQAINQKISQAIATATGGGATAGLGGVVGQGGGIASGVVQGIVSEFQGADYSGIAAALGTGIGSAIDQAVAALQGPVASEIGTIITAAEGAAEGANEVGNIFAQAVAGGISGNSGVVDVAASTMMTTAVTSATGIANTAAPVGTAFTTAVGGGIGAGTGTVTGAVSAMVQAAISGGQSAAAGASAVGDSFDQAVSSGVGASTGTITGAVQAMVGAAIDAGVGAAGGASAIGAAISSGAASGVILDALVGPVGEMVARGIQAGLDRADSGSPSRVMIEQGKWLAEGAAIGVDKNSKKLEDSVGRMVDRTIKRVKGFKPIADSITALGETFTNLPGLTEFGSQLDSIAGNITSTIDSVKGSMKDVIQGIRDGLKQGQTKIKGDSKALGADATSSFNQIIKDRKAMLRGGMKDTKGALIDLQGLQGDVGQLQLISKQLERVEGPNTLAEQVKAMADSLEGDRQSAIRSAVDLFDSLDRQLENAKKKHRKKGREAGDEVGAGLTEGFADSTGTATTDVTSLTDTIINTWNSNLSRLPEMAAKIGENTTSSLSDGMASNLGTVTDTVKNLGTTVDTGLSDESTSMNNTASTVGTDFTTSIKDAITKQINSLSGSGTTVGESVADGFDQSMTAASPESTVTSFGQDISTAVSALISSLQPQGQKIGTALTSGVTNAPAAAAGKTLVDGVKTGITSGSGAAENAAGTTGDQIGNTLLDSVAASCNPVNEQATSLTKDCVPSGLNAGLPTATGSAKTAGQTISDSLLSGMELKKRTVESSFSNAGKGFGTELANGIGSKQLDNKNAVNGLTTTIGAIDATAKGKPVGASFGAGLAAGITSKSADISAAARQVIVDAANAADNAAENRSPSHVFAEIGQNLMAGMQVGIENGTRGVLGAMSTSTEQLANLFAGTGVDSIHSSLNKNLGQYTATVKDALGDLEREAKKSPFADILLPNDSRLTASRKANTTVPQDRMVDNSVRIGSLVVQKGSALERAIFDVVDHAQQTNGQYVVQ